MHAFHPILTAALGTVLLRERFASWQWFGVALGFVGVLLGVPLSLGTGNLALLGLEPVRPHRRHAHPQAVLRRRAAVSIHRRAIDRRRAGVGAADALLRDAALALDPHFAAALAWNTLVMSIFGMAIYNVMLDRHGAGRASSGFFVVPGASR